MDRAKVLDKIKKCFALANNKGATPGEAAAALRSAQRMMEMHQISEAEVDGHEYSSESVQVPIQVNKSTPLHLSRLVRIISDAFGVHPVIESERRISDFSYVIRYFGPRDRAMLATYAHTVVFRAMMQGWTDYLKANPWVKGDRGARTGFFLGWLDTVNKTIVEFAVTEEERHMTDLVKNKHYGRELGKATTNKMSVSGNEMDAGARAAADFRLSTPMTQERLKIRG